MMCGTKDNAIDGLLVNLLESISVGQQGSRLADPKVEAIQVSAYMGTNSHFFLYPMLYWSL
jgi:hypothetical protein